MSASDIRQCHLSFLPRAAKFYIPLTLSFVLWFGVADAQMIHFVDVAKAYKVQGHKNFAAHGVAMGDADNDGYDEIYVSLALHDSTDEDSNYVITPLPSFMYDRRPTGEYTDRAEEWGVQDTGCAHGIVYADIDNDGDLDIFKGNTWLRNRLFRNRGDGFYDNITSSSGIANVKWPTRGVVALDIENDGDIDLYAANWLEKQNQQNELYVNDGTGHFTKQDRGTTDAYTNGNIGTQGATACDVDNDGDMDIFVSRLPYPNKSQGARCLLLINNGRGHFTDEAYERGASDGSRMSQGGTFADYDNDGDLDLFIAATKKYRSSSSPKLKVLNNNGNGYFTDVTDDIDIDFNGYMVSLFDMDKDGDLDLFLPVNNKSNLSPGCEIWLNDGVGNFSRTTGTGAEKRPVDPRGVAIADINNDGDLDIFIACKYGPNFLLRNDTVNDNNWLRVLCQGPKGDACGLGSKVYLYEAGHINESNFLLGYRQVMSASGYLGQDTFIQHFGLGIRTICDVKIVLLNGTVYQYQNVNANQLLAIGLPTKIEMVSGDNQSGVAGQILADSFVVRITDAGNFPINGYSVTFVVTDGGGTIGELQPVFSDAQGLARATFILGTNPEVNTIEARASELQGSPVMFTATSVAPHTLEMSSGNHQHGPFGMALSDSIVVRVKDNIGGNVQGMPVSFRITMGDGSINTQGLGPIDVFTNAFGFASVSWILGNTIGENNNVLTVSAFHNGEHLQNSPLTFYASATTGADTVIIKESGDEQTATVGSILTDPVVIKVADKVGNPHEHVAVRFQVLTGGGSVQEPSLYTIYTTHTDANGLAMAQWRLGTQLGDSAQSLRASLVYGSQSSVTFFATAIPGPPVQLTTVSGDGQTGIVGKPLDEPFVIEVFDQLGVPCVGTLAAFRVTQGSGHFSGDSLRLVAIDDTGQASATLTLGPIAGENTNVCEVSIPGLATVATFTASSIATTPNRLTKVSGDSQVVEVATSLPEPFEVSVRDTFGNSIHSHPVTFRVIEGDGSFDVDVEIQVNSDENGMASTGFNVGTDADICRVQATAEWEGQSLFGSPISFTVIVTANPTRIEYVSGDSLEGIAGQLAPAALKVRVTDNYENPVIKHSVQYRVLSGGGSFLGQPTAQANTDENGIAAVTPTLGPGIGERNNLFEARAFDKVGRQLDGSPIRFAISGRASAADSLVEVSGNHQTGTVGKQLELPFSVRVIETGGMRVDNHTVTFQIIQGDGVFVDHETGTVQLQTNDQGEASIRYRLGQNAGANNNIVEARADNGAVPLDGSPIQFIATALPGAVDLISSNVEATGPVIADGVSQSIITVTLVDSFENLIAGKNINLTVSGTNNNLSQPIDLTDTNGQTVGFLVSTKAETKTIKAIVDDDDVTLVNTTTVEFIAGPPQQLQMVSGDDQQGVAGEALKEPFVVSISDAFENAVANHPVQFIVIQGDGCIIEPQPVFTDKNGFAAATLILGSEPQEQLVEVRADDLSGSPILFSAEIVPRQAQTIEMVSGDRQMAPRGSVLPDSFKVRVLGNDDLPFEGAPVDFIILEGDASFASPVPDTSDANGMARALLAIGKAAGTIHVAATVPGLSDSVFFQTIASDVLPHRLTPILGNFQKDVVGHILSQALGVYVTDIQSSPVGNVPVWFSAKTEGGIILDDQPVYSGSNGVALARVQLGNKSGQYRFEAEHQGLAGSPVIFLAEAIPDAAVAMELFSGNNQTARPTQPLPEAIEVIVMDQHGNGVPNVKVIFEVTGGDGQIVEAQPVMTDSNGVAYSHWILGLNGQQTTQARNDTLSGSPVEFHSHLKVNSAPVIDVVSDTSISENQELSFAVQVSDPEGDAWDLRIRDLPVGAEFDSTETLTFFWTPSFNQAGTHEVIFIATDSLGAQSQRIVVIRVQNINRPPFVVSYQPLDSVVAAHYGEELYFSVEASDQDNDTLSYAWYLAGMYVSNTTDFRLILNETLPNTFAVKVNISDPWETVQISWQVELLTSVDLVVFEAEYLKSGCVKLSWETTEEKNNFGFNVLRALNAKGNYQCITESTIQPNKLHSYSYTDEQVEVGKTYYYMLQDINKNGHTSDHGPVSVTVTVPTTYRLAQNYPNPFSVENRTSLTGNGSTTIILELPERNLVTLRIFNIYGQEIRRLVHNDLAAGVHRIAWDGRDETGLPVPSSVYYYTVSAGNFNETKKLVVLK